MQELFGVCCGQFLREDLQAVAIRVEEVNALGEHVISGELYLGAVALKPLVELPQLLLPALDLYGCMGQTRAADRLIIGHLDDGDVVVALSESEKGHMHLLKDDDQ